MTVIIPEVLGLADDMAGRLASPREVWPDGPPPEGRFWPQSLAGGAIGIALLHAERARSGRSDWKTAHAWLSEAVSGEVTAAPNASLYFGAPGARARARHRRHGTGIGPVRPCPDCRG